jgi:hypothetical protein
MNDRSLVLYLVASLTTTLACGVKVHPYAQGEGQGGEGTPPPEGGGAGGNAGSGGAPAGTGGSSGRGGSGGSGDVGTSGTGGGGTPGAGGAAGGTDATVTPTADTAPASGNGLMIGGKFVPQEKAIVFIHVGHSDMAGRADGPADLRSFMFDTHPQLWVYARGGALRAAKEPTAGDAGSVGKSGPGMALLKTALTKAPDAYFISVGHGHSGAQEGYCPSFRKGRLIWPTFMAAAIELKGKVTFGGLFTMFGITEYHLGQDGLRTTGDCILGLANEVRAELGVPDLPLMVGGWNEGGTGIYSPTGEYGRIVKPQLEMLPTRDPRTGFIPTMGLSMTDDRHLNMAGQKLWAERALMIMEQKGFIPWAAK